jgi:arginine N-succinyltransferase
MVNKMHVLRPIELRDEEAFVQMAMSSNSGILTLPHNPKRLEQKLLDSLNAFSMHTAPYDHNKYLFVLENLETKAIEGCSAISSTTDNTDIISSCFKLRTLKHNNRSIKEIPSKHQVLAPHSLPKNASEVGTLFLSGTCRGKGLARVLSLGRFLFIACHPERFQKSIIVELRGIMTPLGRIPFWECLGRKFCDMDFEAVMELCESNPQLSQEIAPRYPIYLDLLPQEIREAIGKTHVHSLPAQKLLLEQGFTFLNAIDIFDGGPKLRCPVKKIKSIRSATHTFVKAITTTPFKDASTGIKLIANNKLAFRACYGEIKMNNVEEGVTLPMAVALALEIDVGEKVCYIDVDKTKK